MIRKEVAELKVVSFGNLRQLFSRRPKKEIDGVLMTVFLVSWYLGKIQTAIRVIKLPRETLITPTEASLKVCAWAPRGLIIWTQQRRFVKKSKCLEVE